MSVSSQIARIIRKPATALAASLFVLMVAPRAAFADEYDAAFARAIAAKERALDRNDPASWQDAIDLFAAADEVRSTKEAKYELGSAAARLHQDDLAVEAYEAAIELGIDGTAREKASAFVAQKKADMARLEVKGPEGSEVYVGDRRRGKLPLSRPLVVFAGQRGVRVVLGERSQTKRVSVAAGQSKSVDFGSTLPEPGAGAPPGSGQNGSIPPIPDTTPPGGADTGPDRSIGWALGLGGAGLVVVSGVTVLIANSNLGSHRDRLSALCSKPNGSDSCAQTDPQNVDDAQKEVDSIATWKAVRVGGYFGIGAGLVATGVGIVILTSGDNRGKKTGNTSFAIVPAPGGATLSLRGGL